MPLSTISTASDVSLYWSQPVSPAHSFSHDFFYLPRPVDGAFSIDEERETPSFRSGDGDAQRKMFVFGISSPHGLSDTNTSTSVPSATTIIDTTTNEQTSDSKGKHLRMEGSTHVPETKRYSKEGSRTMMQDMRGSLGGSGGSRWVMYDDNGKIGDARAAESRELSRQVSAGPSTPKHRNHPPDMNFSTALARRLTPPPDEAPVKSPTGSKFKEDLGELVQTDSALHWIRQKTKIRRDSTQDTAPTKKPRTGKGFFPKALAVLTSSRKPKQTVFISCPPDDRDLKHLTPRPLIPMNAVEPELLVDKLRHQRSGSVFVQASRRLSTAFRHSELDEKHLSSTIDASLPPRSQSVPPGFNAYGLSFLPSEATSIVTPEELPIFNAKNLGGQKLNRAGEFSYFHPMGMIQSTPPLKKPDEITTSLDPTAQPKLSPPDNPRWQAYGGIGEIAPFVEQDAQCDRPVGSNTLELSPAFARAKSARDSMGSTSTNAPSAHRRQSKVPDKPRIRDSGYQSASVDPVTPDTPTGRTRNSIVNWLSRTGKELLPPPVISETAPLERLSSHIAPPARQKSTEVVLEIAKREKRDTGIIGLDPIDPANSSSEDSFSYAAVSRDIAGLTKQPIGTRVDNIIDESQARSAKRGF